MVQRCRSLLTTVSNAISFCSVADCLAPDRTSGRAAACLPACLTQVVYSYPLQYTIKSTSPQYHQIVRIDPNRAHFFLTLITSPNLCFDAPSFLTKNGTIDIAKQLGPTTKNLDRYLGAWAWARPPVSVHPYEAASRGWGRVRASGTYQ